MSKRVSIIGVNGIGMAHAIAAAELGHQVVAALDINSKALNRMRQKPWCNQWGPYIDRFHPREDPLLTTAVDIFRKVPADLLIISTPTIYHLSYLRALGHLYPKILVEKPLTYDGHEGITTETQEKTYVGHKWLCHADFPQDVAWPLTLMQGHAFPPKEEHKRTCGVVWDLGVHAFAHLLVSAKLRECDVMIQWADITPHTAKVGFNTPRGEGTIWVGYSELEGGEVKIGDRMLPWRTDIFRRQIRMVLDGTHPCPYQVGADACVLVKRALGAASCPV